MVTVQRNPGRLWCASLLAAVFAVTGAAHGTEERPAVVLHNPLPAYPIEAAGSDIVPEATLRVEVDAVGRVAAVEVLRLAPSSEFDDAFERSLKETLSQWRFAPRLEQGQPVPTELQWTTEFLPDVDSSDPLLIGGDYWDLILGGQARHGSSLLALPHDQRVKLLTSGVEAGLQAFGGETPSERSTDWFVVRTNAGAEVADSVSNNLEAVYGVLYGLFGESIPLQSERLKVQVFVFRDQGSLGRLQMAARFYESSPPGFYSHLGLIGMHLQLSSSDEAMALLLHEGTHAFVDRHIVRPGVELPYWLAEGLAEYIANSTIKRRQLVPGKVSRARRAEVRMVQGGLRIARWDPRTQLTLAQIKRAARKGEALSLEKMLASDLSDFVGEQLGLYYGMSWMLVHYLRHGRESWADDEFPRLLLYMGEGYPATAAFETVYDTEIAALEENFRRYIADF